MCTIKPSFWDQKWLACTIETWLLWHEKSGELNERTETKLNHLPRVAELTSAQSEVPPPPRHRHCPKQLQLTHTALWSGPQSVKVWAWVHRLRRWLVTAIERSRKGLSAERTGTQQVAFSPDEEQKGKLTESVFFSRDIWTNLTVNVAVELDWHAVHSVRALQRHQGFFLTWAMTIVIAVWGTLCTDKVEIIALHVSKRDLREHWVKTKTISIFGLYKMIWVVVYHDILARAWMNGKFGFPSQYYDKAAGQCVSLVPLCLSVCDVVSLCVLWH